MAEIRLIKKGEEKIASVIEKECLETPWSESQITYIPENCFYFVAVDGEEIVGIASMYCVFGEGQVMNVAVLPKCRKMGIGKALMNALLDTALKENCENIVLEVAENNFGAICLYENCGFKAVGKRKGFYHGVDALIMEKVFPTFLEKR